MKEQIISFKTAVLAKQKGFDIPVQKFYLHKGIRSENVNPDEVKTHLNNAKYSNWNNRATRTSAPTQSLLQKWLREKHNIHVIVDFYAVDAEPTDVEYTVEVTKPETWSSCDIFVELEINTYEEALEKGLYEALKLI